MSHYYSDEYLKSIEGKPLDILIIPEGMPRDEVPQWLAKIVLVRAIEQTAQILEQLDHPEVVDPVTMDSRNVQETVFVMMDMIVEAMFISGTPETSLRMMLELLSDRAKEHGIVIGVSKQPMPPTSKIPH